MTRFILLVLFVGLTIFGKTQVIADKIQKQIDSSKILGVDTFLVYNLYCNGVMMSVDTCTYEESQYLLWTHQNKYYIKKFDYCRTYKPILLDTINPLLFYISNKTRINKEKIKMPTYVQSRKGNAETIITSTMNHTCFYKMAFQIGSSNMIKSVSDYDLTFATFDNGKKNMYYTYNQKTKLKELIGQLTKLVGELNKSRKWVVE
jgi:hypothetical protein